MPDNKALTADERKMLGWVLARTDKPVTVLLWDEGADRCLSFYAEGTRLEARIAYPEESCS